VKAPDIHHFVSVVEAQLLEGGHLVIDGMLDALTCNHGYVPDDTSTLNMSDTRNTTRSRCRQQGVIIQSLMETAMM